jgi:pilus assembly protein FimV
MPVNTRSGIASIAVKGIASALVCAAILSAPVHAVGLGKFTVLSALGQPLKAELDLTTVSTEDAASLVIKLASAEAFRQANIEFNPALLSLRFSIEQRSNGQVVAITSSQAINEPFVDILLELSWSSGRLVREYTFLLDPPDMRMHQAAPSIQSAQMAEVQAAGESGAQVRRARNASGEGARAAAATQYRVQPGDTLRKIAARVKPVDVSLDQMLAALYRSNASAFSGNNMNRIQAGKILAMPDTIAINAASDSEAKGLVIAHAADFSVYRNNLAAQVAASAAARMPETSQSAAGKIAAKVEERPTPANESKDQLKLSKADAAGKTLATEDRVVKDQQLADAAARVKELEKNVRDLEALMAAKTLQAQTSSASGAAPVAPALPVPKPALAPPKSDVAAPSLLDIVSDNIAYGVGVLLALLLLVLLALRRFKQPTKKAEAIPVGQRAATAEATGQGSDANNSVFNSTFTDSPSQIDMDDVDPLAEADVYIAYGRETQAEEILKEALRTHPERHPVRLKLLEIYAVRKDVARFAAQAIELHDLTRGSGADWAQAAALGLTIDPLNVLYASAAQAIEAAPPVPLAGSDEAIGPIEQEPAEIDLSAIVGATSAALPEPEPEVLAPVQLELPTAAADGGGVVFDAATIEAASVDESGPVRAAEPAGLPSLDIDFDMLAPAAAVTAAVQAPSAPSAPASVPGAPDDNSLDFDFDFDLPSTLAPAKPGDRDAPATLADTESLLELDLTDATEEAMAARSSAPVVDLSGITLDLGKDGPSPDVGGAADAVDMSTLEVEMDTKLELAVAYQEIGDNEGARELIDEVINGGNKEQVARALSMQAQLG